MIAGAVMSGLVAPALAQICREPGSTTEPPKGMTYIDCDMSYRDSVITCLPTIQKDAFGGTIYETDDKGQTRTDAQGYPIPKMDVPGTRVPCPAKPMPMLRTPLASYIWDYTPYLYAMPRDKKNAGAEYNGLYYVGTPSDKSKTEALVGDSAGGTVKRIAACTNQIKMSSNPRNASEDAVLQRLKLDNCANQYILYNAIYPFTKENTKLVNNQGGGVDPISMKTECQPLRLMKEVDNDDYSPAEYLEIAWRKSLVDASYRKNKLPELPGFLATIVNVVKNFIEVPDVAKVLTDPPEPHLPKGVEIVNPIPSPVFTDEKGNKSFPPVRLSHLAAVPYEEIIDPTHPYSPRWDFVFNEREFYSPMTKAYMQKTKNAVFCAGVKEAKADTKDAKKEDLEVKVDVLSFRKKKFEDKIYRRIAYNTLCKLDEKAPWPKRSIWPLMITYSYCFTISAAEITRALGQVIPTFGVSLLTMQADRMDCWKCFGLTDKIKDEQSPPCATNYLDQDKKIEILTNPAELVKQFKDEVEDVKRSIDSSGLGKVDPKDLKNVTKEVKEQIEQAQAIATEKVKSMTDKIQKFLESLAGAGLTLPGALNGLGEFASCNLPYSKNLGENMYKTCDDLRRPFVPMNKLKMRYHNPDDPDNNVLTEGVPEGYAFANYFGNHMPYPRLWDTGFALSKTPPKEATFQDPNDTTGQYTAIVGVGREGAPKSATSPVDELDGKLPSEVHKDERCKTGGWATNPKTQRLKIGRGIEITLPDPMTSWTELKAYQMNAVRNKGISCIGRYEKMFKDGSSEAFALKRTAGVATAMVIQECDKANPLQCEYLTLKEVQAQGGRKQDKYYFYNTRLIGWPYPWMGYESDLGGLTQFPGFIPEATGYVDSGMGNVRVGDILILHAGGAKYNPGSIPGDGSILGTLKNGVAVLPGMPDILGISVSPGLAGVAVVKNLTALGTSGAAGGSRNDWSQCEERKDCYVEVEMQNNGKLPDVCGVTEYYYTVKTRKFYKPGHLPPSARKALQDLDWTTSCEDPKLDECEFSGWDSVEVFHIQSLPEQPGCEEDDMTKCGQK